MGARRAPYQYAVSVFHYLYRYPCPCAPLCPVCVPAPPVTGTVPVCVPAPPVSFYRYLQDAKRLKNLKHNCVCVFCRFALLLLSKSQ